MILEAEMRIEKNQEKSEWMHIKIRIPDKDYSSNYYELFKWIPEGVTLDNLIIFKEDYKKPSETHVEIRSQG